MAAPQRSRLLNTRSTRHLLSPKPDLTVVLSSSELDAYAGTYYRNGIANHIVHTGDGLTTQVEGTPQTWRLFALGNDQFLRRFEPANVVFSRDATGAIDAVVVHRASGQVVTWVRDGMTPPAQAPATPPPSGITLDASVLAQYVGTYPLEAGTAITITAGGVSGLVTQITGPASHSTLCVRKGSLFLKGR